MSESLQGMNLRGAVDLSALTAPPPQPIEAPEGLVVEVDAASFGDLVQRSLEVPVVVDLYSTRSAASQQLSPVLVDLAKAYDGAFLLARIPADTNPEIAQAFGVQALPTTVALVKGQPLPLFQGAYAAEQIRPVLDEVLKVAAENGVTGRVTLDGEPAEAAPDPEPEPLPPHIQAAYDAIEAGDLDAAAAAYRKQLDEAPLDADAKIGLAQVHLMARLADVDPAVALAAANADPADLDAALVAADLEVGSGLFAEGFGRLVAAVRSHHGDERERARGRLVELFQFAPEGHEDLMKARRDLAAALF